MANNQNLNKKGQFINKDLAAKAGKKSGVVRRELKNARDTYNFILSLNAPEQIKEGLKKLMPELPDDMNNRMALYLKTFVMAANGNIQAVKEITDRTDGLLKQEISQELSGEITSNINIKELKQDLLSEVIKAKHAKVKSKL
jgi:hypothetical protein